MKRHLRTLVGLVAGALLLTGCGFDVYSLPLPGGADVGDKPMTVDAQFRDVLDLVPQSAVKVNDVTVGKITSIKRDGYLADVSMEIRNDVDLPANVLATIRQTSLLGEKFVSLDAPATGDVGRLTNGAMIPVANTGRNPEVEEVLGALSMVLNGGGIGRLKIITTELNKALNGREDSARSVLTQVSQLMTQLNGRKQQIVDAIGSINRLAVEARRHMSSIDQALDKLPGALDSLSRQRTDLRLMLQALAKLGNVGVRVIQATKASTIDSLRTLNPVLANISRAGDDFVNAFSTFLTYPFIDESVGRDPTVARNLHMGDYVNLSVNLDLDLNHLSLPGLACIPINQLPDSPLDQLINLKNLCKGAQTALQQCLATPPNPTACATLPQHLVQEICSAVKLFCSVTGGGTGGTSTNPLSDLLNQLGIPLGRAAPGFGRATAARDAADEARWNRFDARYDADLVTLMAGPLSVDGGAR
jgi:phospholipid/cholesterol/gamma-HCH transport system substrate-binding protein